MSALSCCLSIPSSCFLSFYKTAYVSTYLYFFTFEYSNILNYNETCNGIRIPTFQGDCHYQFHVTPGQSWVLGYLEYVSSKLHWNFCASIPFYMAPYPRLEPSLSQLQGPHISHIIYICYWLRCYINLQTQLCRSKASVLYSVLLHISAVYISHHQLGIRSQKGVKREEASPNK